MYFIQTQDVSQKYIDLYRKVNFVNIFLLWLSLSSFLVQDEIK